MNGKLVGRRHRTKSDLHCCFLTTKKRKKKKRPETATAEVAWGQTTNSLLLYGFHVDVDLTHATDKGRIKQKARK
jgi:hypothetical protein